MKIYAAVSVYHEVGGSGNAPCNLIIGPNYEAVGLKVKEMMPEKENEQRGFITFFEAEWMERRRKPRPHMSR
jgi:hypothetical protein